MLKDASCPNLPSPVLRTNANYLTFTRACNANSSVVFLLHIALESPIAIQGIWSPSALPFLDLNNTTVVLLKLYSALVTATCISSFLCFSLPGSSQLTFQHRFGSSIGFTDEAQPASNRVPPRQKGPRDLSHGLPLLVLDGALPKSTIHTTLFWPIF